MERDRDRGRDKTTERQRQRDGERQEDGWIPEPPGSTGEAADPGRTAPESPVGLEAEPPALGTGSFPRKPFGDGVGVCVSRI